MSQICGLHHLLGGFVLPTRAHSLLWGVSETHQISGKRTNMSHPSLCFLPSTSLEGTVKKHSGPNWFDEMFSAHCAQGQWLHKAEGSRDYDSWIVNEWEFWTSPLRMAGLAVTFSQEELAFYYNLLFIHGVMPYYSIMRSVYYIQIPFRKSSFALFNKCSIHIFSNVVDCLFIKIMV